MKKPRILIPSFSAALVLFCAAAAVAGSGRLSPLSEGSCQGEDGMTGISALVSLAAEQGLALREDEVEEITPPGLWEETGARLFLNRGWERGGGRTLVLSGGQVRALTRSTALQDCLACDLDGDGSKELVYAASASSGMSYVLLGAVKLDTLEEVELDLSAALRAGGGYDLTGSDVSLVQAGGPCCQVYGTEPAAPFRLSSEDASPSEEGGRVLLGTVTAEGTGLVFSRPA